MPDPTRPASQARGLRCELLEGLSLGRMTQPARREIDASHWELRWEPMATVLRSRREERSNDREHSARGRLRGAVRPSARPGVLSRNVRARSERTAVSEQFPAPNIGRDPIPETVPKCRRNRRSSVSGRLSSLNGCGKFRRFRTRNDRGDRPVAAVISGRRGKPSMVDEGSSAHAADGIQGDPSIAPCRRSASARSSRLCSRTTSSAVRPRASRALTSTP